jgi:hypothetical protein
MAPKGISRRALRSIAFSLWITPLILLFPMWYGALYDPGLIWKHLGFFVGFFGLPFCWAAIFYYMAAKTPTN